MIDLAIHGCLDTTDPKPIWVLTEMGRYDEYWLWDENDDSLTRKTGDVDEIVYGPGFYFVELPEDAYDETLAAAEKRFARIVDFPTTPVVGHHRRAAANVRTNKEALVSTPCEPWDRPQKPSSARQRATRDALRDGSLHIGRAAT